MKFLPNATQADRQSAIDAVHGTVVGGMAIPTPEGYYAVRVPYVLSPGDNVAAPSLRARVQLRANPKVKLAMLADMDPRVSYAPMPRVTLPP